MNEAKIQISFIRDDPGLVIRCDTAEEAEELLKTALPIYKRFRDAVDKGKAARAKQQQEQSSPPGTAPTCGIHGTIMEWRTGTYKNTTAYHKAGDQYAFWGCSTKNADGSFCKYKPGNR